MAVEIIEELESLRRSVPLSGPDIARAAGVAASTVRSWLARTRAPGRKREERILELVAVAERLRALMKPEYVPLWLRKPNPLLDHRKPIDVISRGGYRSVLRIVAGLESPPAS